MKGKTENWLYLSHPWGPSCPPYGGKNHIQIKQIRSIQAGDTANALEISGPNHIGTHFDFPLHFSENGKNILDFSADFFLHQKVLLFWLKTEPGNLITSKDLEKSLDKYAGHFDETIALIRSGATLYRQESQYWKNGPGLSPGVATFFRKNFKNIRTVGVDMISVSCFQKREVGREVHKEFLCETSPIVLIEDMNLEPVKKARISFLIASPLRIEKADGAPCTVIARI